MSFGHVESDECGAMNQWLAAAPDAQVVHGATACMVSLNDLADRPPRALADGEVLDLGGKRVRWIDTPHVPHAWESGLMFEETTGTLFTGDLFTHAGDGPALTHESIVPAAIARRGRVPGHVADAGHRPHIRRLAALQPSAGGDARLLLRGRLRGRAERSRGLLPIGPRRRAPGSVAATLISSPACGGGGSAR